MEKLVYKFLDNSIGRNFKFRKPNNNSGRFYVLPSNQDDISEFLFRVYVFEGKVSRVDFNYSTIDTISNLFSIEKPISKYYVKNWFMSVRNIEDYDDLLKFIYE